MLTSGIKHAQKNILERLLMLLKLLNTKVLQNNDSYLQDSIEFKYFIFVT